MPNPDATTREQLADLRRLLREGQARAQDRTSVGQHAAIVLLDAACEHAVALAAGNLGLPRIKELEKSALQVSERLGDGWSLAAWKEVLDLRGQRNQAQHRGTRPDARDVARWSQTVPAFVASLVEAVFDVQLAEVAVSDGIENAEVRRWLRTADQALEDSDYAEAKFAAVDAFDLALEGWRAQRPKPGVPWYDHREANLPEGVTVDLEALREQALVQPFATDYGEYLWLRDQHRRYARQAPVPAEDALRALAFVTEWILRWETHARRQIDRDAEWLASQEPEVSGVPDAGPSVRSINVEVPSEAELVDPATVRVRVVLQDLPTEDRFRWAFEVGQALSELLMRHGGSRGAVGDQSGALVFELTPSAPNLDGLLNTVTQAILAGTEAWTAWRAREAAEEAAAQQLIDSCKEALKPWIGDHVRSVDLVPGRRDAVRVRLNGQLKTAEPYWLKTWALERFGDQPGRHRIAVAGDWIEVPVPEHDDTIGELLAHVLSQAERAAAERASVRVDLEAFAGQLQARLIAQLTFPSRRADDFEPDARGQHD